MSVTTMTDFPTGCVIVFGGSGGLGQAVAALFAERGSDVVVTHFSRPENGKAALDEIRRHGRSATTLQCSVANQTSVDSVFTEAVKLHGRVHSVVTAMGQLYKLTPMVESIPAEFHGVMETDVTGFYNISRAAVAHMRKNGGGSITALVTCAYQKVYPDDALSAVPKAAQRMMLRQIAVEEGPYGIRTNGVGVGLAAAGLALVVPEIVAAWKEIEKATPLRRSCTAREIAEVVAFLASSRAAFVTGQIINCDGGLML